MPSIRTCAQSQSCLSVIVKPEASLVSAALRSTETNDRCGFGNRDCRLRRLYVRPTPLLRQGVGRLVPPASTNSLPLRQATRTFRNLRLLFRLAVAAPLRPLPRLARAVIVHAPPTHRGSCPRTQPAATFVRPRPQTPKGGAPLHMLDTAASTTAALTPSSLRLRAQRGRKLSASLASQQIAVAVVPPRHPFALFAPTSIAPSPSLASVAPKRHHRPLPR